MRETWIRAKRRGRIHLADKRPVTLLEKWVTRCGLVVPAGKARLIHKPTKPARCRSCEAWRAKHGGSANNVD